MIVKLKSRLRRVGDISDPDRRRAEYHRLINEVNLRYGSIDAAPTKVRDCVDIAALAMVDRS